MNADSPLPSLGRFASTPSPSAAAESEPLTICGDILRAAHTETKRVAADEPVSASGPELKVEAMLGVISYCYSKGVVSSHEIEEHLWHNLAFLNAFGNHLPTAQRIRQFRRKHREAILATIERALQHFWSRSSKAPCETDGQGQPALDPFSSAHVRAQQLLDAAIFVDGMELE